MFPTGEAASQGSRMARTHCSSFVKDFWKPGAPLLGPIQLLLEGKPASLVPLPVDNAPSALFSAPGSVISPSQLSYLEMK